jgi:hypothetical protein
VRSSGLVDQWISALNETPRDAQTSRPFAPALFSGGEGGRRPDEGVFGACAIGADDVASVLSNTPLIRLRHLLPPQKARGEKALDWRGSREGSREGCSEALNETPLTETSLNETPRDARTSSPFAPALFSGGEGGRRPDEGAFGACAIGADDVLSVSSNTPLIRLRHLLPPQKARGEKALDWGVSREDSREGCSEALNETPLTETSLNETPRDARTSSPFAPALLSGGEGGRRPDEGAFGALDWGTSQVQRERSRLTSDLLAAGHWCLP